MSRPIISGLFALAAMVPATGRSADYVIGISAVVPLACRVTLNAGTLHEFCNSGRGYRVYAMASPELVGATLVVDGERKRLGTSETLLSSRNSPGIVNRSVEIRGATNGSLSLRIEAI